MREREREKERERERGREGRERGERERERGQREREGGRELILFQAIVLVNKTHSVHFTILTHTHTLTYVTTLGC